MRGQGCEVSLEYSCRSKPMGQVTEAEEAVEDEQAELLSLSLSLSLPPPLPLSLPLLPLPLPLPLSLALSASLLPSLPLSLSLDSVASDCGTVEGARDALEAPT